MTDYRIVRSGRKTLCIQLSPAGDVIVRAPRRCPQWYIEQFVTRKAPWIETHRAALLAQNRERDAFLLTEDYPLTLLGRPVTLRIAPGRSPSLAEDVLTLPSGDVAENRDAILRLCRTACLPALRTRLDEWAARMGVTYRALEYSTARTRWGSCTGDGVIRISVWLLFAPARALDYVLVHELAHRRHFDHSPAFWAQVAAVMPDYPEQKAVLKRFQQEPFLQSLANRGR